MVLRDPGLEQADQQGVEGALKGLNRPGNLGNSSDGLSALYCVGLVVFCGAIRSADGGGGSDWYWCRVGVLTGYDLRLLYICH